MKSSSMNVLRENWGIVKRQKHRNIKGRGILKVNNTTTTTKKRER